MINKKLNSKPKLCCIRIVYINTSPVNMATWLVDVISEGSECNDYLFNRLSRSSQLLSPTARRLVLC